MLRTALGKPEHVAQVMNNYDVHLSSNGMHTTKLILRPKNGVSHDSRTRLRAALNNVMLLRGGLMYETYCEDPYDSAIWIPSKTMENHIWYVIDVFAEAPHHTIVPVDDEDEDYSDEFEEDEDGEMVYTDEVETGRTPMDAADEHDAVVPNMIHRGHIWHFVSGYGMTSFGTYTGMVRTDDDLSNAILDTTRRMVQEDINQLVNQSIRNGKDGGAVAMKSIEALNQMLVWVIRNQPEEEIDEAFLRAYCAEFARVVDQVWQEEQEYICLWHEKYNNFVAYVGNSGGSFIVEVCID